MGTHLVNAQHPALVDVNVVEEAAYHGRIAFEADANHCRDKLASVQRPDALLGHRTV